MDQPWTPRPKPDKPEWLERRIEFPDYSSTRDFLERLNALSDETQLFPDISFGRTYVNLTLRAGGEAKQLVGEAEQAMAVRIDGLLNDSPQA